MRGEREARSDRGSRAGETSDHPGDCPLRAAQHCVDRRVAHLTNRQVLAAGLTDWRMLAQGLHARFDTAGFCDGAAFLDAVGALAETTGQAPIARISARWVELTLSTEDDGWWVTEHDVDLALRISDMAWRLGPRPDPSAVAQLELALDTADAPALGAFWSALLTGSTEQVVHGDVMDADQRVPNVWFQDTETDERPWQRFHVDLWLPAEVAAGRIAAALAAGGSLIDDARAPAFVVLADPEGNKACVCTAEGR